ncbi:DUF6461 domain-containing protein [Labedaea rhizosphaerae]|uniref:Uncharacterized protein n=1 Tax=Labedaea rhizosphaerae TaxID=598644 RepID=A0A4R6SJX5_LABRH|nr:DUF6461 domain-containing protein [Labedaea rhizosphaerae]TDQ01318.1 hypothetical protein EV186_1021186 [Labedaea rhizosphaerae]
MLSLADVRRYAWADEDPDLAWTVAVVRGRSADEVVRAYGGDPTDPPRTMAFREAVVSHEELGRSSWLLVHEDDGAVIVLENNGWFGTREAVAKQASAGGGHFMSVHWDLNANHQLLAAIDGELVTSFDPLLVEHQPEWLDDVVLDDESLHAVLLAVLAERTGVVAQRQWLTAEFRAYLARRRD